ncbi:hypothetical protein ANN_01177 [Periplaneta americana]|uniref:Uncharacterized protein n=1 Tax=Periplaneta americana TaxID=6978 RepID=A0ABQ8TSU7_PERAM|nr:hypothetical protein ANN_01177 [Periplaneta americana]
MELEILSFKGRLEKILESEDVVVIRELNHRKLRNLMSAGSQGKPISSTYKNIKGVRLRVKDSSPDALPEHYGVRRKPRKYLLPTPTSHLITVLCFLFGVFVTIVLLERKLPVPLKEADAPSNPGYFIAERAMKHLMRLTDIGPRTAGSYENEVLAIKFFSEEIGAIANRAKQIHKVQVDVQKTSGAFPLHFLDGMTNVYKNVQNVIVRVSARHAESVHSLLVNCHFDTVSGSPDILLYDTSKTLSGMTRFRLRDDHVKSEGRFSDPAIEKNMVQTVDLSPPLKS